jgi:hypothetical protein
VGPQIFISVRSIQPFFIEEKTEMENNDRSKPEPVEVICPRCRLTKIVYLPVDDLPLCPKCNIRMSINELLDEGKSY